MTDVRAINAAAAAIHAAMQQGRTLPISFAAALEAAGLLQTSATTTELEQLRARVADIQAEVTETRPIDEEPVPFTVTEQAVEQLPIPKQNRRAS